jgi:hypothetical protein
MQNPGARTKCTNELRKNECRYAGLGELRCLQVAGRLSAPIPSALYVLIDVKRYAATILGFA